MGTDIHSVVQIKVDGKWETVHCRLLDDPRSYNTFSILADVRNGYGFAGCKTSSGFKYISKPKGYPKDFKIVDEYMHQLPSGLEYYWFYDTEKKEPNTELFMGDHSHSWFTLRELKDWWSEHKDDVATIIGVVHVKEYLEYKESGKIPESYCGMVWGKDLLTVTGEEYESIENKEKVTHVQCYWPRFYHECTQIQLYVDELEKIAGEHNMLPEDTRLVFGFDS